MWLLAPILALLGHQLEHPKLLRVGVQADRLLVSVTYDLAPGQASQQARALFDRDGDGALNLEEQEKLATYLEKTALLWLRIELDDAPLPLMRIERSSSRLDLPVEATQTLGIALLLQAPLPQRPELRLRIHDRDREADRHVPLSVDLSETWRVRFASEGELSGRHLGRIGLLPQRAWSAVLRRR